MYCIVHGVTKSQTQLSDFHFTSLHFIITHTYDFSDPQEFKAFRAYTCQIDV